MNVKQKKLKGNIKDMTGYVMAEEGVSNSRITVIRFDSVHKTKGAFWLCRCSCGTEKIFLGSQIRNGSVLSCGCLRTERARANMLRLHKLQRNGTKIFYRPFRDMTGWNMWEHGIPESKLRVIRAEEDVITPKGQRQKMWLCECTECGNTCSYTGGHLRHGDVLTCGCGRRKPRAKNGKNANKDEQSQIADKQETKQS